MPEILASFDHLADLDLYKEERPYLALLPPSEDFDPTKDRRDNLAFDRHDGVVVRDMRNSIEQFRVEECGFEVLRHRSNLKEFLNETALDRYQRETEKILKKRFDACFVKCYDIRLRKNVPIKRTEFDFNDRMLLEGPARGAHVDVTVDSGPEIIQRYLSADEQERYLRPGYRFRIFNTWRSLLPELHDQPLGLCDFRSVEPEDLVPADRVLPNRVGEVYYLRHNKGQKWFWLEQQRDDEPFVFIMYDTAPGSQARYCPHVSFVNSRAPANARPRESVETRSIVITKL